MDGAMLVNGWWKRKKLIEKKKISKNSKKI